MKFPKVILVLLVLTHLQVATQTGQLKGVIRDSAGIAVPAVNVIVDSLSLVTVTDTSGYYQLSLPAEAVITNVFNRYSERLCLTPIV